MDANLVINEGVRMRRRVPQIIVSILLGMMLLFCQMAPGLASTLEQKKEELSEVNSQLKERKQQLRENEKSSRISSRSWTVSNRILHKYPVNWSGMSRNFPHCSSP